MELASNSISSYEERDINSDSSAIDQNLIDAVRKQLEYYFSKENLQNDPYLTSQMDAQMSVPISVVMKVTTRSNAFIYIKNAFDHYLSLHII